MRIAIQLTILALMMGLATACLPPTKAETEADNLARYEAAAESWRGAPVDALMAAWPRSWFKGLPEPAGDAPVYAFIRMEEFFLPAEQYFDHANNEWVEKSAARAELVVCETRFLTDGQGIISGVSTGGSQCGLFAPPPSRTGE